MASQESQASQAGLNAMAMPSKPLDELLTIVLVTSPIRSHPSTEMLERTLSSYVKYAGLAGCPKIIVSDGFSITGPGQKERPKSGRVPAAWALPYAGFRDRLDALTAMGNDDTQVDAGEQLDPGSPVSVLAKDHGDCLAHTTSFGTFSNCRHLRMEQHKGFGGCTYCALRLVMTPYVLVLQHDRPCLRAFQASQLVAAMEASHGLVKYIGLPTKSSLARIVPAAVRSRDHFQWDPDDMDQCVARAGEAAGIQLRVLLFWYDSSHICEVSHYRDFVFAKGRVPAGGFPEDTLGQAMHGEITTAAQAGRWHEAHAAYGTYLYVDGDGPVVGHLRGRRYIQAGDPERRAWGAARPAAWVPGCHEALRQGESPPSDADDPLDSTKCERSET